ncbi:DUF11 domain-containing protein, partial [bacterium]|nr:DUF11 domain-containing protein [bacterium]
SHGAIEVDKEGAAERLIWTINQLPAGASETMTLRLTASRSGNYDLEGTLDDLDFSVGGKGTEDFGAVLGASLGAAKNVPNRPFDAKLFGGGVLEVSLGTPMKSCNKPDLEATWSESFAAT